MARGTRALLLLAATMMLLPAPGPGAAQVPPLPEVPLPADLFTYHTYATLQSDLESLVARHPDLARLATIGQSRLGLDLWTIEIGKFDDLRYNEKPAFYLDAAHHGNEALSLEAAYLFAEQLAEGYGQDPATTAMVDAHRTFITPLVNPDGKTLNTRTNGAGVNLNRNYPFHWDERGTGPVGDPNYAGPSAGSEPEVQATMALLRSLRPSVYVSLHTGSYDLVRPFGFAPDEPLPDEALYQELFRWAQDNTGLEARWPGGSGESICWAYGVAGIFSVLPEVYEHELRPAGAPQFLYGPLTNAEVRAALDPHLQVFRHLLANTGRWGAWLEGALEDLRGSDATLVVSNSGFSTARNITAAATGAELRGALPTELAPGQEARVPVRLTAPSQVRVTYDRLAITPEDPDADTGTLDVLVPFRTGPIENVGTPGPSAALALGLVGLAALAAVRARRIRD